MNEKRKPKNPITKIRTGSGDNGTTWFRGNLAHPKASPEIRYLGKLDTVQSHLVLDIYVHRTDNLFIRKAQDLVFALGANFNSPANEIYIDRVTRLTLDIERDISVLTEKLSPLTGFIRTTNRNVELRQAGTSIREAEILYLDTADTQTDHKISLNALSDFIFALAWRNTASIPTETLDSYNEQRVPDNLIWKG